MELNVIRKWGALVMIAGASVLSGCASNLGVGSSEYGCTGLPEGIQCMSAREVYELTEQPGPVRADPKSVEEDGGASDQAAKAALLERKAALEGRPAGSQTPSEVVLPMADNAHPLAASPISNDPIPIRTRAKIMRVWVAPWESTDGDLHVSGLIFTELEERRWNIGTIEEQDSPRLTPLQTRQQPVEE